ncbi:O-methyltransferase [Pinibacter aurantiacus]|uniref:O-methyltransferase n=1 Tax=Pinibacter aurantiacus TaxID=2851599 RepID=A0A9E2S9B5_9BACT|nr:O-methyltransferase [Pinibacter aurantiacus]MBV4357044.1 O-methyltransferase [Pinibacter aurantiacus]
MELISSLVEAYADKFTSPEDEVMQGISAATQMHDHAHMLSGHVQGKFLELISRLVAPKYILEIGTFTGYSAVCLAKGLQQDGILHTIELREEDAATAQKYFTAAGVSNIQLHIGNAMEIIPTFTEAFDIVFIDADKTGYLDYYKMVLPKVRKGGLIVADNVLFHGQVLEEPLKGKNAKAIQAFNEYVQQDASVEQVLLTVRDGLLFIVKK